MDIFEELAKKIIEEQESIIGPIAVEEARKVQGLSVDWQHHHITFHGNKTDLIERLVEQYKGIFGQISVDACKEAVRGLVVTLPTDEIPRLLR